MGLVVYPKPQLDIVLHQTARDIYSYFDCWRAPAAGIYEGETSLVGHFWSKLESDAMN